MYPIMPWNPDLETGIQLIDQQHMEFFKNMNRFLLRMRAKTNAEKNAVSEQLDFLHHYLLFHFQAEEAFMVECNYTEYREHQAEHNHLSFQVKAISTQLEDAVSPEKIDELSQLLSQWVRDHILHWDLRFAECYRDWQTH